MENVDIKNDILFVILLARTLETDYYTAGAKWVAQCELEILIY